MTVVAITNATSIDHMSLEELFEVAENLSPGDRTGIVVWRNKHNVLYHVDIKIKTKCGSEVDVRGEEFPGLKPALSATIAKCHKFLEA